jgi:hypothetical protein
VASPFRPASYPAVPLAPRRVAGTFIAVEKYLKHRLRHPRCNSVGSPRPALAPLRRFRIASQPPTITIAITKTTSGRTRRPTPQQPRHDKDNDKERQERIIVLNYYSNKTYMRGKMAWPCRRDISDLNSQTTSIIVLQGVGVSNPGERSSIQERGCPRRWRSMITSAEQRRYW